MSLLVKERTCRMIRVALFQGYVVTCDEENKIPLNAQVIGEPITKEMLEVESDSSNPILANVPRAVGKVAVDAQWLAKTFNDLTEKCERFNDRIIELLEDKQKESKKDG